MSGGDRKPGGRGRQITEDEAELWRRTTQTLAKLKAKPRIGAAATPPPPPPPREPPVAVRGKPKPAAPPPPPLRTAGKPPSAPIAAFERRKVRQIASGRIEIDARIDLHGLRQGDARARLRAFLLGAHAEGHKTVLVITGKGGEQERADRLDELEGKPQRGVLRRNVPRWLEEPELRAVVLSFTAAGVRHGGDGALYVQLRKAGR